MHVRFYGVFCFIKLNRHRSRTRNWLWVTEPQSELFREQIMDWGESGGCLKAYLIQISFRLAFNFAWSWRWGFLSVNGFIRQGHRFHQPHVKILHCWSWIWDKKLWFLLTGLPLNDFVSLPFLLWWSIFLNLLQIYPGPLSSSTFTSVKVFLQRYYVLWLLGMWRENSGSFGRMVKEAGFI